MHLAQLNVALGKAAVDAPEMAEFVANLDRVNALGDAAPGFVWRLQDEDGNATSIHPYDDERMIINLSVWESIEALWSFVYDGGHLEIMRRRREWFQRLLHRLRRPVVGARGPDPDGRGGDGAARPPPGPRTDRRGLHLQAPLRRGRRRPGVACAS